MGEFECFSLSINGVILDIKTGENPSLICTISSIEIPTQNTTLRRSARASTGSLITMIWIWTKLKLKL